MKGQSKVSVGASGNGPDPELAGHQARESYTPHYLMFKRDMPLPTDVVYGLPTDHPAASSPSASVWQLREHLANADALICKKLPAVHRQKANFDRPAVSMLFTEGDIV